MKILVVDDDAAIRSSIRRTLIRRYDAEVFEAESGIDALERLLRTECDLVLLDLQMPAMDGIKTLQAVRRSPSRCSLPVVMLTGTADESKVRQALSLGIQEYLLKPIQPDTLAARLTEVLARTAKPCTRDRAGTEVLTLRKGDRVLVIEPNASFLDLTARRLSRYCSIDGASSPERGLEMCAAAPPVAVFLGGQDDFSANAVFLARMRNDDRLSRVPVFALVSPDRMASTWVGFEGVLPRTLDDGVWEAAATRLVRTATDHAKYFAAALDATCEYLTSIGAGEVLKTSELRTPGSREWMSARIDFSEGQAAWSASVHTTPKAAAQIAAAGVPGANGSRGEASAVSALRALATAAFERVREAGPVDCTNAVPRCEFAKSVTPPSLADGVLADEQWVLVLESDILVLVRLSSRQGRTPGDRAASA